MLLGGNKIPLFLIFLLPLTLFWPYPGRAQHGSSLLISQIQITGGAGRTTQDFVELYNPTAAPLDLNGLRLIKRTATGSTDTTLKSWTESTLIPAHGHYLWANNDFTTLPVHPDTTTSGTLADNNGIALRRGLENTGEILDALAWGNTQNGLAETAPFAQNPGAQQSLERLPGGEAGQGTDTQNNVLDFMLREVASPRGNESAPTPPFTPLPENAAPQPGAQPVSENNTPATNPLSETPLPLNLVINELLPDPAAGESEALEFYNRSVNPASLAGLKIFDGTGTAIYTFASGTLEPQNFFVVRLLSARLNNAGDRMALQDAQGNTLDAVSYGTWNDGNLADNAPAPEHAGQALARLVNGADTNNDRQDFGRTETPTLGAGNVLTVQTFIPLGNNRPATLATNVPLPRLVINELVADPEDGPEWVEIYNRGEVSVDLENWYLEEGSEAKTKLTGTLIPGQFKVVQEIAGNLNNKGDILRLKNPKGEVLDKITYGTWEDGLASDNAPVAEDPQTLARRQDGQDTDNDKADFDVSAKPTPGKPNILETPKPAPTENNKTAATPSAELSSVSVQPATASNLKISSAEAETATEITAKLQISEFLPNPAGPDTEEWLELFWDGESPLNLRGFTLDDSEGGSRPFLFLERTLPPKTFLVLTTKETGLTLNNDQDSVRLLDPTGRLLQAIEYEEVEEGASYARTLEGLWQWTWQPTPGQDNIFQDIPKEAPRKLVGNVAETAVLLEDLRSLPERSLVRTQGVVSALPGTLGQRFFYLAGSAAQVYLHHGNFPKLHLGQIVEVAGRITFQNGLPRITLPSPEYLQLKTQDVPPTPQTISTQNLEEDLLGSLLQISGTLLDVSKTSLLLDDGTSEIIVGITKGSKIDPRRYTPGARLMITGILVAVQGEYRILPRDPADLVIQKEAPAGPLLTAPQNPPQDDLNYQPRSSTFPYAKTTVLAGGGALLLPLIVSRRRLFLTGLRAVWFFIKTTPKLPTQNS